jgi:predicted phosphodiesterase
VRVAALYDVHGNVHALEAVLAEVERERVDAIVFGGDVLYGPFPAETLELARSVEATWIRGNCERLPLEGGDYARWVYEQVPETEWEKLAELPTAIELDGVCYCHATPTDDMPSITDATSDERLEELLAGTDARLVVGGHTHMQQRRGRYANAGSVGMPYEDRPGAYWAIVAPEIQGDVEHRRTEYDYERAAAAIRATSHPIAEELAAENVLKVPTRAEAIAAFSS